MIIAIVQARMSSTRLPGKVMKRIVGKPMIFYLLERLKYCQKINRIVVATTSEKIDDSLVKYVKRLDIDVFRGSENDILSRFYFAAKKYRTDDIVRITADCPLIEPQILDKLINFYFQTKADYVCLSPRFAEGLDAEVFSFKALRTAFENAKTLSEKEHVSLYIHNNKDQFKRMKMTQKVDDSKIRITVDEVKDYVVVQAIFKALYKKNNPIFHFAQIKNFLLKNPQIKKINMDIIRNEGLLKSLKKDKKLTKG